MKLYVGNISFNLSSQDIRTAFSEFGRVESADVIHDRVTGRSRGFAFVHMVSDDEGESAIGRAARPCSRRATVGRFGIKTVCAKSGPSQLLPTGLPERSDQHILRRTQLVAILWYFILIYRVFQATYRDTLSVLIFDEP